MTYRETAIAVLRELDPLHCQNLTEAILESGLVHTAGATPAASLSATITVDIGREGRKSALTRIRPGVFGLRGLHEPSAQAATVPQTSGGDVHEVDRDEANLGVRVPFFPIYSELRHLLRIWPGPRDGG